MRAVEIMNVIFSTEGQGSNYERVREALTCEIFNNLHLLGLRSLAQVHDYVGLKATEEEWERRGNWMGED